ncbi:MAG TPA: hypothetical protein VE174_06390, partial [Actinomycetota bacterium]|nr:hypothetical protein [Actinomycetota bacterium]
MWEATDRRISFARIAVAVALAAMSLPVGVAQAQDCETSWTNAGGGAWNIGGNWDNGVPGSDDNACITLEGTYAVTVSGFAATVNSIDLGAASGTQTLTIQSHGFLNVSSCLPHADASLTTADGGQIGDNGGIVLTAVGTPGCGLETTMLEATGGTLTNAGTIRSEEGQGGGNDTFRKLRGNITNTDGGVVDIDFNTNYDAAATFLNDGGTVDIANAKRLYMPAGTGATFTNDDGEITVAGSGHISLDDGNTFNQGGGTTSFSDPVYVENSALNYTGTGASKIRTAGENTTLSGNIASGQDLIIEARAPYSVNTCLAIQSAKVTASQSFTNAGDITLTTVGMPGCAGEASTLEITNGTLTNTGTILSEEGGGGSGGGDTFRHLKGNVTNAVDGFIDVDQALRLGGTNATHTNAGGEIAVASSETLFEDSGTLVQTSGATTLGGSGAVITATTAVDIQGGTLSGVGTVGPALANDGTVAPGGSAGIINVSGAYSQTAGGTLAVEVGGLTAGTQFDKLAISGAATLGGTLDICTDELFTPEVDDEFQILTHATRNGTFATVDGTAVPDGNHYEVSYAGTNTTLTVAAGGGGNPAICGAAPVFEADSLYPDEGGAACCVTVFVHGMNFAPGVGLTLSRDGETDIVAEDVAVAEDGRSFRAVLDLTGAAAERWDVTVDQDGGSATIPGGFSVESAREPDLWVAINGPRFARPQQPWNGTLAYGNTGNVDGLGVEIRLSGIPDFDAVSMRVPNPPSVVTQDVEEGRAAKFFIPHVASGMSGYIPLRITFEAEGEVTLRARIFDSGIHPDSAPKIDPDIDVDVEVLEATDPDTNSPAVLNGIFHVTGPLSGDIAFDYEVTDASAHVEPTVGWTEPSAGVERYTLEGTTELNGEIKAFSSVMEGPAEAFAGMLRAGNTVTSSSSVAAGSRIAESTSRGRIRMAIANPNDVIEAQAAGVQLVSRTQLIDCLFSKDLFDENEFLDATAAANAAAGWGSSGLLGLPGGIVAELFWGAHTSSQAYMSDVDFEKVVRRALQRRGLIDEFANNEAAIAYANQLCARSTSSALKDITVSNSRDPNEKSGPEGSGEARYIEGDEPLPYEIKFENIDDPGTLAAQEVRITDNLHADLDPSTLSLGPVSFGDVFVVPPPGLQEWTTDVDLRPDNDLIVRIEAELDGNELTWFFQSLDPVTMEPTTDAEAGFLPPNDDPPEGEGSVSFSVSADAGLPSGSEIENSASIVFDTNEAIVTNTWLNTIDNDVPVSEVDTVDNAGSCDLDVA